jgi:hypothetical protein
MMEKVEIAVRVLGVGYALGICGMILQLQGEDTSEEMAALVALGWAERCVCMRAQTSSCW